MKATQTCNCNVARDRVFFAFFFEKKKKTRRWEEDHNSNGSDHRCEWSETRLTKRAGARRTWAWCRSVRARKRAAGTRPSSTEATKLRRLVRSVRTFMGVVVSKRTGPMSVHVHPAMLMQRELIEALTRHVRYDLHAATRRVSYWSHTRLTMSSRQSAPSVLLPYAGDLH